VFVRHTVPQFRFTPVVVVNGEEHKIFIVPAECRVLHANIEPGHVDTGNVLYPWELQQAIRLAADVAEVPRMTKVILGPRVGKVWLLLFAAEA
jgi:hypothetical protein